MMSSFEVYQKLIHRFKQAVSFILVSSEFNGSSFGDFLINVKYKRKIMVEINNDRSLLEIGLLFRKGLLKYLIPFAFVAEVLSPNQTESIKYVYDNGDDVYNCLIRNKDILEKVMKKSLQKEIIRKWKKKCFL